MNPFARLIDPAAPVPQPRTMNGYVHVLADEIDHSTMAPASKPGPKPQQGSDGPVQGLPRLEMQYQRDESVCLVATAHGTLITEVFIPVACWVPTAPTTAAPGPAKPGRPPKAAGMLS